MKKEAQRKPISSHVAGIDGCKAGWICLIRKSPKTVQAVLLASIKEIVTLDPLPDVVLIDIPIGLPAMGQRRCDAEARQLLGPRRSSIFPSPTRAMLSAHNWHEACAIRQQTEGLKISLQAWNITAKVREVDTLLQSNSQLRETIHETHPELAFAQWAGSPMAHPKKTVDGKLARKSLVESFFGQGIFDLIRQQFKRSDVADDDILDAFAALWSAERFSHGKALVLPLNAEKDDTGIVMQIVV
ncbi:MAG: hypothetical protein RI953_1471 [Pseudomonadota bacterium]